MNVTTSFDPTQENALSLAQAAKLPWLPRRRAGKPPHVATLIRWATKGLGGVRLSTLRIGGTLCTSERRLVEFFDRLTAADASPADAQAAPAGRTERQRQRDVKAAKDRLESAGIAVSA